jgi:phenylpyruvate tautomerase PptA (4-oxalocrotonate tautomerase family)
MPYLSIETNLTISATNQSAIITAASALVAQLLGKPEQYVMIALKPQTAMVFGGSDAPTAFLQLNSIGLPKARCDAFAETLCLFLQEHLNIAKERVFIAFNDLQRDMFAWNAKTF